MLKKDTAVFAQPGLPLECDIYSAEDYPPDSPVLLFFHSGGLVGGARQCVPPWLIQSCFERQWPLVSASYRLLPQAKAAGLLEDAAAAFEYAQNIGGGSAPRKVIVAGASAGFFMASLIAFHVDPQPLALLSITGIPTFQHPFFNSNTLLTPRPLTEDDMRAHLSGPIVIGKPEAGDSTVFAIEQLLPTGKKNPRYSPPKPAQSPADENEEWPRGCLYDYYLYHGLYPKILGDLDPGFDNSLATRWPKTVIIQGNADEDVSMEVSLHTRDSLGPDKVEICLAEGQGHLFESRKYLEDDTPGMEAVRAAVIRLDEIVTAL